MSGAKDRGERGDVTRTNPSAAKHLPPGKVLAGRFRLDEILGVGGMGVVYAAHDLELDLPVAVKLLRPEMAGDDRLQERFRREIILARQVSHRHVVRIHDLFQDGDLRFLTMDLVRGRSLRDLLRSEGPLPPRQARAYALQLARALEAAHEQGVVHRDLKPENVLVQDDGPGTAGSGTTARDGIAEFGMARISDFGIARSLGGDAGRGGLTATGTVVGSLDYLSPEQAKGGDLDGRSDVYSLGLIVHEMLTGELPFRRGSDFEMLAQRISASPSLAALDRAPAKIPGWLRKVLQRMLQRDPQRRYDATGLVRDLESESFGGGAARRRASRWLAATAALLLGALAVAAWWGLPPFPTVNPSPAPSADAARPTHGSPEAARPKHALAVLPLVDRTGRPELHWVPRGGAEMLAQALTESRDLRVVDSFRVFRLLDDLGLAGTSELSAGRQSDLAELLDVDRLVSGVVQPAGDDLRLELRLLEPGPGGGTRALTADARDLASAVSELTEPLRKALEVQPTGVAIPAETPTDAARTAYDQGVEHLMAGDAVSATELLAGAVADSPDFVSAWLRLSDAYERQGLTDEAARALRRAARANGDEAGRRAMEIAAREADLRGDAERSQELWQRLVDHYPQDSEARVRLASAHGEAGDLDRARELLHEVVAVDSKHPRAWYLLSKYAIQAGDLNRAVDEYLVHALVIQNQLDNDQGRADVLNAMGVAYDRLGRLELAEQRYAEASELRRQLGDLRGYSASLRNLGALAAMRGDYAAAESRYDEAESVLEELGDRYGVASLANQRGMLEEEKGDYRKALDLYRQALQMRRDLGDKRVLAESYNNVGYAYYLLGDYDNAGVYWRQALDELEAAGNRQGEIFVRQSLGLLHLARGRWDDSARAFLDALEASRELDMPDTRAVSHGYLGRLAQLQGHYAAALDGYDRALSILQELADPRGLAEFGLLRAETLFELGAEGEATSGLASVRAALNEAENQEQSAILRLLEARMALRRGDVDQAAGLVHRASDDAEASHSVVAAWKCRWTRAEVDLGAGRAAAARSTFERLAAEADALGHAELYLLAAESLGRASLELDQAAAAGDAFESGLRVLPQSAEYAGAYRLLAGLSAARAALGDEAGAKEAADRALAELDRLVSEIRDEHQAGFQRLKEVASLG